MMTNNDPMKESVETFEKPVSPKRGEKLALLLFVVVFLFTFFSIVLLHGGGNYYWTYIPVLVFMAALFFLINAYVLELRKEKETGRKEPRERWHRTLGKLKESPPNKTLILATLIIFIPFILLTLFFWINEYKLESSTGYGVLDFELAWTPEGFNKLFTAWGPDNMKQQIFVHHVDNLYIPFYALFTAGCILIASRKLKGKLQEVGLFMTLTPIIGGIFDAVENVNLLLMLGNKAYIRSLSPLFASLCATIKIGFLVIGVCFFVVALIVLLIRRIGVSTTPVCNS